MNITKLIIFLSLLSCNQPTTNQKVIETENKISVPELEITKSSKFKIIHVFVALCDNEHQGIANYLLPMPMTVNSLNFVRLIF